MSYKHFTLSERECLEKFLEEGKSLRKIAKELGRSPSSISRELKRNKSKYRKSTPSGYHPWRATILYMLRRRKCVRRNKIGQNTEMDNFIIKCLNDYWPPEVVAEKCKEKGYNISFSTIYSAIKRGLLPDITEKTHLRRRGVLKHKQGKKSSPIQSAKTIHERPAIVDEKVRLGDLEGDTVYGAIGKGCLVTLVDRVSRMLYAAISPSRSNKHIHEAFLTALIGKIQTPIQTITLDNGAEFAGFKDIESALNTEIYFADPHSPWQRGLNENTNDILRFFFPKGTNFLQISDEYLQHVIALINNRPRKCLDFLSPLDFISKKCCT